MAREFIRTDKNGTKIFIDTKCYRCGGFGVGPWYQDGGICYECNGSGISNGREVKEYTPEYAAKLEERRKARAEKKHLEMLESSKERRNEWLEREGFSIDGKTYLVLGNTYPIKDELREHGYKFSYSLGWHIGVKPVNYPTVEIDINEVADMTYDGDWGYNQMYFTEAERIANAKDEYSCFGTPMVERIAKIKEEAENKIKADAGEHISEYIGSAGDKLEMEVTIDKIILNDGMYGTTFIHIMHTQEGNRVTWFGSNYIKRTEDTHCEEGETVKIKATVKGLDEYKGTKTTLIIRPKLI